MVEPTFCSLTRRVFGSDLQWFKRHIPWQGKLKAAQFSFLHNHLANFSADVGRMSQDTCYACKPTESS
jgi:hypothetical protein